MSLSEVHNVVYVYYYQHLSIVRTPLGDETLDQLVSMASQEIWNDSALTGIDSKEIQLLFSNPVWSGASTVPTTVVRNITAVSSALAYQAHLTNNLTTLTTTNAETLDGVIEGLLYVPEINQAASCNDEQYQFIPYNVTRQANLPPTNYNLIAIAPWFSIECTQAYLASARLDPIRAFIFYKPNNSSNQPQDSDSPVWNLDDGGRWKSENQFPIFSVPGLDGQSMMQQLSLYSGPVAQIPHTEEISSQYNPNPNDYVRIWTELTVEDNSSMLALWVFFLIVIGSLLLIVLIVSFTMHYIQRGRRQSLRRRVESGEVDLEAMGIKRLTVPEIFVKDFPLYTYNSEPEMMSMPSTPMSAGATTSPRSARSSRRSRRPDQRSIMSDVASTGSIRSHRSSLTGSVDTTATNFQPNCQICLVRFQHRFTIIRELPCGHIFHSVCIDEFLTQNSSMCPMCKQCMLPRGYSPRITNGMVRRERAVRRLRGRVDLDDSSLESGETKLKAWGKKFFSPSPRSSAGSQSDVPMTPIKQPKPNRDTTQQPPSELKEESDVVPAAPETIAENPDGDGTVPKSTTTANGEDAGTTEMPAPAAVKKSRPRQSRPRQLKLLPTHPENGDAVKGGKGRSSPSSFARERMRQIAASNAPFDDPDSQIPKWRRAFGKVFPGL